MLSNTNVVDRESVPQRELWPILTVHRFAAAYKIFKIVVAYTKCSNYEHTHGKSNVINLLAYYIILLNVGT